MEFREQFFDISQVSLENGEHHKTGRYGFVAKSIELGYYPSLDDEGKEVYVVTHLASGFAMDFTAYNENDAIAFIEAVAPLTDWKQSAKDIWNNLTLRTQVVKAKNDVIKGDRSKLAHTDPEIKERLLALGKEHVGA